MVAQSDFDVIVIGAGLGGLTCAAKLASRGRRVLLIERKPHIGGTSFYFSRQGFRFPMGPLSFSHPDVVLNILKEIGISDVLTFQRSHFQLLTPDLDIVMSKPLAEIEKLSCEKFPREITGIAEFFSRLKKIMSITHERHKWHPDYRLIGGPAAPVPDSGLQASAEYDRKLAKETVEELFKDQTLRNFLGNQSSYEPRMSLSYLASMWDVMSQTGIWHPEGGTQHLAIILHDLFKRFGGETLTATPVQKIRRIDGRTEGVVTRDQKSFRTNWIVSNVDPKTVFSTLLSYDDLPGTFYRTLRTTPYTPSEICVYLGVDPSYVDFSRMSAPHVFYRKRLHSHRIMQPFDFENREIEVCLWSQKDSQYAPEGKAAVILRCGMAYDLFAKWRTGERQRRVGYKEWKMDLARRLIRSAEGLLPGLEKSITTIEVATPLTYRDWGYRYEGSLAGWTWHSAQAKDLPQKLLIRTPYPNLLFVGIFAASELFLGGVPTAMYTGSQAADFILAF